MGGKGKGKGSIKSHMWRIAENEIRGRSGREEAVIELRREKMEVEGARRDLFSFLYEEWLGN